MSADNWGICPKCKETAEKNIASAYGKVSEEEYLATLNKRKEVENETTLREDYEVGVDIDGEFSVSYSCHCSKCGFKFEYKYSQELIVV